MWHKSINPGPAPSLPAHSHNPQHTNIYDNNHSTTLQPDAVISFPLLQYFLPGSINQCFLSTFIVPSSLEHSALLMLFTHYTCTTNMIHNTGSLQCLLPLSCPTIEQTLTVVCLLARAVSLCLDCMCAFLFYWPSDQSHFCSLYNDVPADLKQPCTEILMTTYSELEREPTAKTDTGFVYVGRVWKREEIPDCLHFSAILKALLQYELGTRREMWSGERERERDKGFPWHSLLCLFADRWPSIRGNTMTNVHCWHDWKPLDVLLLFNCIW